MLFQIEEQLLMFYLYSQVNLGCVKYQKTQKVNMGFPKVLWLRYGGGLEVDCNDNVLLGTMRNRNTK